MSKFNNAKALALGRGLTVLTSLILLPYLSRSLPISVYGSYGQVLFYIEIFKAFALFGLNKVVFIYISKSANVHEAYSNNIFASFFAGSILAIVCIISSTFISGIFDNPLLVLPISIYAITIPFDTCYLCYSSLLVNEMKSKLLSWIAILSNILRAALLLIIIQHVHNLVYIFLGLTFLSIVQCLATVYFSKIYMKIRLVKYKSWMAQVKQGFPLGLTSIMGTLYYLTDSLVVSSILTSQDYAILRNGAFQIPFISTLYSIVGLVLMRDLSDFVQKNDLRGIISLKSRAILLTCIIIFPITIFLIVYAKYWLPFLFSSVYAGSVLVFMIYNIMTLFRVTNYENVIVLSENGNKLPIIYLSSFLINVICSIPLTYLYGPSGSAVASIFSFLFLISFLTNLNLKYLQAKVTDFISSKQFFKIATPSLFLSVGPYLVIENLLSLKIPIWSTVLSIFLLLGLTYHLILKSRIVKFNDLESLIKIVPVPFIQKLLITQYCK